MKTARRHHEVRHPIRVVTARTGLSRDVLRAWERRYGIVSPGRSDGGHRLYSDADVERLSLLHKASLTGRAVSTLATLGPEALADLLAEDADQSVARPTPAADHCTRALAAVHDLQPEQLEAALRRALLSVGTTVFLEQVLKPVLVRIGDDWHRGRITIAHEHAASAAVVQLLGWLVRELEVSGGSPCLVLATPERELHALGAMIAAAAAAHDGWHTVWLGADLPVDEIAAAARRHDADVVGLSVVTKIDRAAKRRDLKKLRADLGTGIPLLIGGSGAAALGPIPGATTVRDLTHWRSLLGTHLPVHHRATRQ